MVLFIIHTIAKWPRYKFFKVFCAIYCKIVDIKLSIEANYLEKFLKKHKKVTRFTPKEKNKNIFP